MASLFAPAVSARMRAPGHIEWVLKYAASFESGKHWLAKAKRIKAKRMLAQKKRMASQEFDMPPCITRTLYPTYPGGHPNWKARSNAKLCLLLSPTDLVSACTTLSTSTWPKSAYASGGKQQSFKDLQADLKRKPAFGSQAKFRCKTIANNTVVCPYKGDNGLCAAARVNDFDGTVFEGCVSGKLAKKQKMSRSASVSLAW